MPSIGFHLAKPALTWWGMDMGSLGYPLVSEECIFSKFVPCSGRFH